jgi:hypothetical protein
VGFREDYSKRQLVYSPGSIGLCDRSYTEFPRMQYTGSRVSENNPSRQFVNTEDCSF